MCLCRPQWDQRQAVSRDMANHSPWDNNWVDGGIVALWVFCFKPVWVSPRQPSELVEDKTALRVTLEPQSLVSRKDSHTYLWGERYRKFYMGSAWKKGKRERRDFETPVSQGQGCLSLILASIESPEQGLSISMCWLLQHLAAEGHTVCMPMETVLFRVFLGPRGDFTSRLGPFLKTRGILWGM